MNAIESFKNQHPEKAHIVFPLESSCESSIKELREAISTLAEFEISALAAKYGGKMFRHRGELILRIPS